MRVPRSLCLSWMLHARKLLLRYVVPSVASPLSPFGESVAMRLAPTPTQSVYHLRPVLASVAALGSLHVGARHHYHFA